MSTGLETTEDRPQNGERTGADVSVVIDGLHQRLTQVLLKDVTDRHNQLVRTQEWLLHIKDTPLKLTGNVFAVECPLTGKGKVFVKCAPLPNVRCPEGELVDLTVNGTGSGFEYVLHQTGPEDLERWHVLDYEGGVAGRTRAIHQWQQSLRPTTQNHQLPRFISNTWGDRNRDACIQHDFILQEIEIGAKLGAEVIQIDDGWQKGVSHNSAKAKEAGGVGTGFWDSDADFWTPDPQKFPHGFEPIVEYAGKHGVEIGLWYAPDTANDFENWRKDVEKLLSLHRQYQVNHFKLDFITAENPTARRHLTQMFEALLEESKGELVLDLDVTAGVRPGYFGEMRSGPLFVENRYSDWHSYWPHFTLRNLWQLSHWVNPRRLRMEFLNNARNRHKYEDDPLAPALYPPATTFAVTMFSNPLGWFENSGLEETFVAAVSSLVICWKAHREALFAGDVLPIGQAPDGVSWTGFCSTDSEIGSGYALVFNERNPARQATLELPKSFGGCEVLHGTGSAHVEGTDLSVTIPESFGYLFIRLGRS